MHNMIKSILPSISSHFKVNIPSISCKCIGSIVNNNENEITSAVSIEIDEIEIRDGRGRRDRKDSITDTMLTERKLFRKRIHSTCISSDMEAALSEAGFGSKKRISQVRATIWSIFRYTSILQSY